MSIEVLSLYHSYVTQNMTSWNYNQSFISIKYEIMELLHSTSMHLGFYAFQTGLYCGTKTCCFCYFKEINRVLLNSIKETILHYICTCLGWEGVYWNFPSVFIRVQGHITKEEFKINPHCLTIDLAAAILQACGHRGKHICCYGETRYISSRYKLHEFHFK